MNKFKSYYFSFIEIVSLVGTGYVVGFYSKVFFINNSLSYLGVIPMGLGCFLLYMLHCL